MNLKQLPPLNEREQTVVATALEQLRDIKQRSIIGTDEERASFKKINQFDNLAPQHTLMHVLTLLAKLTGKPVEHFANQNPSQNPPPKTHE